MRVQDLQQEFVAKFDAAEIDILVMVWADNYLRLKVRLRAGYVGFIEIHENVIFTRDDIVKTAIDTLMLSWGQGIDTPSFRID